MPTLAEGLDGSVRRISRTYADDGRSTTITSYSAASGVPFVQYAYNNGSVGGTQPGPLNSLRRHTMILPNGREVAYSQAAGFDTRLGRLSSLGLTGH